MCIHSSLTCFTNVFIIGISRHRHNWYRFCIRPLHFPDYFCGCNPIHHRHHNIHDNHVKGSFRITGKSIYCLLSVHCRRYHSTFFLQNAAGNLHVQFNILHQQNLHPCQINVHICFGIIFLCILIHIHPNLNHKFCSNIIFAFNLYCSAHQINKFLCDRHPQSGTFICGSHTVIFLGKRIKQVGKKFLLHSYSCICQFKLEKHSFIFILHFSGLKIYFSAILCKFN